MSRREVWRQTILAPFGHKIFLAIWTASLVSNFGSLIEVVGASWLMTSLAPSADMVALVQASTTLPIMLLSLAAGAIADVWDRRRVMLIAQLLRFAVSATLSVLAYLHQLTPWSLLGFTFLVGVGTALHAPAWQSSVGEQVPREQISAAVSLNSLSYNLARTAGPAVGGVLVAAFGAAAAFLANTVSYIGLIVVLLSWRRPRTAAFLPPENVLRAMAAGARYARLSPGIRTVLLRGSMFGLLGAAVWALMPLIARDLIGGGARTYGVLLGAFGVGAVIGALSSATVRLSYRNETIVSAATLGFGLGTLIAGLSSWHIVTVLALVLAGASWVLGLSTLNVTIQTSSPRWVVGRTLAIYQTLTFGGLAIGSWLWGQVASDLGLRIAMEASGVLTGLSALLGWKLPLPQPEGLNLDPSRNWSPEQAALMTRMVDSGPIVVTVEYRIAAADVESFLTSMRELRRVRRRDGARRWTLMQDVATPEVWIERFHSPNWIEHLRRHHRFTVSDQEIERRVLAFHQGEAPPTVRHFMERAPSDALGDRVAATDPSLPSASASLAPAAREPG